MEKNLPKNWTETDLGTVLSRITNGSSLKQQEKPFDGSYPITRIETIWKETIDLNRVKYVKPSKNDIEKYGLHKGDILFSHINSGKHIGKTVVFNLDETVIHGINLLLLRTKPYVSGFFLNYLLTHFRFSGKFMEKAQHSVNQCSINQKKLKEFVVPLPPFPEQQRIVAKADVLMAKVATMQKSLERIPKLLKEFRQQVLTQAVTGKLTKGWRKGKNLGKWLSTKKEYNFRPWNINLPESWNVFAFQTVANINANLNNPNEYLNHILIAPNHIEKNTGRLIETQLTKEIMPKSDKHYFEKGSIIYSKIRPYLSKLILADFDGLCSADMYPISAEINQKFLFHFMLSQTFLQYATTAGERSVLPKINQKGLNNIPVPVPPLLEQKEIVHRVESLFAKVDAIEGKYKSLKRRIDTLPQAILHKAFKGELVAQLPNDGDAKELLREIKGLKQSISV